jgi:hypothetical protein
MASLASIKAANARNAARAANSENAREAVRLLVLLADTHARLQVLNTTGSETLDDKVATVTALLDDFDDMPSFVYRPYKPSA